MLFAGSLPNGMAVRALPVAIPVVANHPAGVARAGLSGPKILDPPTRGRYISRALRKLVVVAALLCAGGLFAWRMHRPRQSDEERWVALASPKELLDRSAALDDPAAVEKLAQALIARGRPAFIDLLAVTRDPSGYSARDAFAMLDRMRRESPDPALRADIDHALRDVFPLKIRIDRTVSDEEFQREAAQARIDKGEDMAQYWYDPMGSRTVGTLEADVHTLGELVALLAEENDMARKVLAGRFALEFVFRFGDEAREALTRAAKEEATARGAAQALCFLQRQGAIPLLIGMLQDPREGIRKAAVWGLWDLGPDSPAAVEPLLALLQDPRHRDAATQALLETASYLSGKSDVLLQALEKADAGTRLALLQVLPRVGVPEWTPLGILETLQQDPDAQVAAAAKEALEALRPQPQPPEEEGAP